MLATRLGVLTSLALACLLPEPRAQSEAAPDEGGASALSGAAVDDGDWIDVVWPGDPDPASGDYLRVGGLFTLDLINWDSGNDEHDGFETRALSLILSGRLGEANFFVDVDLEGENTRHNLREAWIEHGLGADHWIRAGWLRVAHGSEFATRQEDLPHVGYGFTSWMNGRFGPGVSVDGYPLPWLWWQAVATAGHDADLAGSSLGEPQGLLRFVAQPEPGADGSFEGLFGGVSISKTTDLDGPVHVETPFQQTSFSTVDLEGDSRDFVAGELGYRRGGFRAGAEMTTGEVKGVDVPVLPDQDIDEIGRYMFWASWNLRGPAPVWSRGRWLPYDLKPGDEMPLELAVRYSNADINRDFFTQGLTSFGPSVNEARTITLTASLYLQPTTRLSAALLDTVSDQVSSHWGEGDVSYLLRLDQRF